MKNVNVKTEPNPNKDEVNPFTSFLYFINPLLYTPPANSSVLIIVIIDSQVVNKL